MSCTVPGSYIHMHKGGERVSKQINKAAGKEREKRKNKWCHKWETLRGVGKGGCHKMGGFWSHIGGMYVLGATQH